MPACFALTHAHVFSCAFLLCSIDTVQAQKQARDAVKVGSSPLEVRATDADNALGAQYFAENRDALRADLLKYGALWLRGFDLPQTVRGYREMYEALGLDPCLDPLHSSGLRKFASERDALYEEVRWSVVAWWWWCVVVVCLYSWRFSLECLRFGVS